jgi:hypothetical protein
MITLWLHEISASKSGEAAGLSIFRWPDVNPQAAYTQSKTADSLFVVEATHR